MQAFQANVHRASSPIISEDSSYTASDIDSEGENFNQENTENILNNAYNRPNTGLSSIHPATEKSEDRDSEFKFGLKFNHDFDYRFQILEDSDVMLTKFKNGYLYIALASGTVKVYTIGKISSKAALDPTKLKPNCLYILEDQDTYKNTCTSIDFLNDSEVIVVSYSSGMVKFWHITSKQCLTTINEPVSQTLTLAFSKNNEYLYTAGQRTGTEQQGIYQYDVETRKLLSKFTPSNSNDVMDGHMARVHCIKTHPGEKNEFISAGWDNTIQFWDTRVQHSTKRISGVNICSEAALDIQENSQGNIEILAASWRRHENVQIYDWDTTSTIKSFNFSPRIFELQKYFFILCDISIS